MDEFSHTDGVERTRDALTVFNVLGHPLRNHVLRLLWANRVPMSLAELAALVEAEETEPPTSADGETTPESTAMTLHHVHLPRLDAAGLIRYDCDERVVVSLDGDRLDRFLTRGGEILASLERD